MRKGTTDRKPEICQTALTLAFECGPAHVTTGMIADRLGLTQPAIYKHFPRKSDIWLAIADSLCNQIAHNITLATESDHPAETRLRGLVTGHLKLMQETPALPEIMVMRDADGARSMLQIRMRKSMTEFRQTLTALVRAAATERPYRADLDAGDASALIFGIIQSLALRMLLSRNPSILLENGERLLNLLLSGFTQQGEQ